MYGNSREKEGKECAIGLFAERAGLIDTENASKIGPLIRAIEEQGKEIIKCNLGEPDFSVPEFVREEVKRQQRRTSLLKPSSAVLLRNAIEEE